MELLKSLNINDIDPVEYDKLEELNTEENNQIQPILKRAAEEVNEKSICKKLKPIANKLRRELTTCLEIICSNRSNTCVFVESEFPVSIFLDYTLVIIKRSI